MPIDTVPFRGCCRERTFLAAGLVGVLLSGGGCKELTGSPGLPAGTPNPAFYSTPSGAVGMRNAAVFYFERALSSYVVESGLLTDELDDQQTGASAGVLLSSNGVTNPLDERILVEGLADNLTSYAALQRVRGYANQALGALATFDTVPKDTATAKVLRGELYAFEGYTELLLADLYCSGVPLSTLDFQGDFTYRAGSTTAEVYQDARAKFDTALSLGQASDSVRFLAQILKGRANLALGLYAAAADDVTTVPDGFVYQSFIGMNVTKNRGTGFNGTSNFSTNISDREGLNGLPFHSSGDPRAASVFIGRQQTTQDSLFFPAKYQAGINSVNAVPFTVASGIEARLIEAEAALNAGQPSWLATLNALRKNAAVNTHNLVPNLDTLTDPGAALSGDAAATARIALLFRERAFWLYLDGHRQGDLRRLLRQYGSRYPAAFGTQNKVYPTGPYLAPGTGLYGADVTVPIPSSENPNPLFTGCKDRQP